ncbi:MAG: ABC-2 transporter permease [Mycoplasmatales bacterium]|nr:ABC-2 transporter permease [Mycoplasmatales bacterium]
MTTKRWTTYLFPVLFLFIFTILIAIKAKANNTDNGILWRLGFYYYIIPFACSIIFSTLKSINIFKENEENNTELIIVSKPFKRWQIILAKFFVLYTLFILYSLIVLLWMFVISFIDKPSTNIEKIRFAASLSMGSLIIMFLTSSIVVLLSQLLNSLITISIMGLVAISPLATSIIAPLTHAQHLKFVGTPHYMVSNENVKASHVRGEQMFFFNPSGIKTSEKLNEPLYKRMKNEYQEHKKSVYKYVSYLDVYEQLSGFLSIFQDRQWNYESIGKWHESTRIVHSDYQFTINGWKYIYMYWNDSKFNELTASKVNKVAIKAARYVVEHKNETKWKNFSTEGFLKRYKSKEWKELVSSYLTSDKESFDNNALQLSILMAEKENEKFKQLMYRPIEIQDLMYIKGILADGGEIPVYVPEKYIPKINIFLGWGSLMMILGMAVALIYYKKDFK